MSPPAVVKCLKKRSEGFAKCNECEEIGIGKQKKTKIKKMLDNK